MQTISSKIQKSAKLFHRNANGTADETIVDGSETARRFYTLAAYIAESLSSRGDADAALFRRLLPNGEDTEIIKQLWDHAIAELAGAAAESGWETEAYENETTYAPSPGIMTTVRTAAIDYLARCMTADWIRIRGCRPVSRDMLATERYDIERAKAGLQSALSGATRGRIASPRRFPPI